LALHFSILKSKLERTGEGCFYGQRKESSKGEGDLCVYLITIEKKVFQKAVDGVIAKPY
jgi:hypothetical protein